MQFRGKRYRYHFSPFFVFYFLKSLATNGIKKYDPIAKLQRMIPDHPKPFKLSQVPSAPETTSIPHPMRNIAIAVIILII